MENEFKVEELKVTTTTRTVKLTAEDIISQLRARGIEVPLYSTVKVYFTVPGGGDWSGENVDIDKDNPITIIISTQTEERT